MSDLGQRGAALLKFNPSEPRVEGGEHAGEWTSGLKKGGRAELASGIDATTNKPVAGPVRGTIVRLTDSQVMINAGTKTKPKWVYTGRENAHTVERAKPRKDVGPGRRGYFERLTPAEIKAVDAYKGYGYQKINGQLRAGKQGGEAVRQLDNAVRKGSLGGNTKLYRSFHMENIPNPGDIIADRGFASTSTRREVAERFTEKGGNRAMVRIHAPAGTPAAFLPGQHEDEVLLGRNSHFVVKAAKTETSYSGRKILVVDVEVVPNEP